MNCRICNSAANPVFTATVLNKHTVQYFSCPNCDYLFTETPYWLDQAYNRTINLCDTGIIGRNIHFSKLVAVLLFFLFNRKGKFLDYAGGYGIFTRLMRDIGFDFYWHDPYCQNLLAQGFEYDKKKIDTVDVLTTFEVFEHLADPLSEIDKMLAICKTIVFSTELLPSTVPNPAAWWYYGFEHGQHISFYSEKTLRSIAEKYGLYFYTASGLHIFTNNKLTLSLVKLLLRLARYGLFTVVKKNMNSKTWDDHHEIKKKNY